MDIPKVKCQNPRCNQAILKEKAYRAEFITSKLEEFFFCDEFCYDVWNGDSEEEEETTGYYADSPDEEDYIRQ